MTEEHSNNEVQEQETVVEQIVDQTLKVEAVDSNEVVVTKDSFDVLDLNRLSIDKAKERIGDWFVTQMEY